MRSTILLAALALPIAALAATPSLPASHSLPASQSTKLQFGFEQNQGQTDSRVHYLARTATGTLFFTEDGLILDQSGPAPSAQAPVQLRFSGANSNAGWKADGAFQDRVSYHVGRDRSRWADDVERYARLTRTGLYPGIDVSYYGSNGRLEYDFVVAPGADPSLIRFEVSAAGSAQVNDQGELSIDTGGAVVYHRLPLIYQIGPQGKRIPIQGGIRQVADNTYGFKLGNYDRSQTLYIDPVLDASRYIGGSDDDRLYWSNGGTLMVGTTASIDFPLTNPSRKKGRDIFVSMPSPYGSSYTVIVGGSGDEQIVTATANARLLLVVGNTTSDDLPTQMYNAFGPLGSPTVAWQAQKTTSESNGFVIALRIDGVNDTQLLTYIGGSGKTELTGGAIDGETTSIAVVGTTDTSDVLPQGSSWKPRPPIRGGLDGFVATAFSPSYVGTVSLFGGSGDDIPRAIAFGPSLPNQRLVTVGGETTSPDLPLLSPILSQRSGDSDGFILQFSNDSNFTQQSGTLLGGAGTDSVNAIAVLPADAGVVVAGATSSQDFPLLQPLQSQYGGGDHDAFITRLTPGLTEIVSSTLLGGSGDDKLSTSASDSYGSLYFAGTTSSADLKTRNAAQPSFGGGTDGWFLHYLGDGSLYQVSYWGGSGDDEILGLSTLQMGTVTLAGSTTSPNLTVLPPGGPTYTANRDGFMARIASSVVQGPPIIVGENLRSVGPVLISGPESDGAAGKVKATSQNPSLVLVAANWTDTATASVELPVTAAKQNLALYVECAGGKGKTTIQLEAPGHAASAVPVSCTDATIGLTISSSTGLLPGNTLPGSVWFSLAAFDSASRRYSTTEHRIRPDAAAPIVTLTSSDPSVAAIEPSQVALVSTTAPQLNLRTGNPGTAVVTATAPGFVATALSTRQVQVGAVITASPTVMLLRGFQTSFAWRYGYAQGPASGEVMITSDNGDFAGVSLRPSEVGTNRVVIPDGQGTYGTVYLQSKQGSGSTQLFLNAGNAASTTTINVVDTGIYLNGSGDPTNPIQTAALGTTGKVYASVTAANRTDSVGFFVPSPSLAPIHLRLESSDPAIAVADPAEVDWGSDSSAASFSVKALKEGTTTLKLIAPDSMPIHPLRSGTLTYRVVKAAPSLQNLEVGRDLSLNSVVTFSQLPDQPGTLTLKVDRPDLVQLAARWGDPGREELQLPFSNDSTTVPFTVYALAEGGTVNLNVDVPGYGSASSKIQLAPSAPGWSGTGVSIPLYGGGSSFDLNAVMYALDAATRLPVAIQSLRPGTSRWIHAEATTAIASVQPADLEIWGTQPPAFKLKPLAAGNSQIVLSMVDGGPVVGIRKTFDLTVQKPELPRTSTSIGKDFQMPLPIYTGYYNVPGDVMVTAVSADPSKLLLTTDVNQLGRATVQVPFVNLSSLNGQALSAGGTVAVRLTAPGFVEGEVTVSLVPLSYVLELASPSDGLDTLSLPYRTTTLSSPSTFQVRVTSGSIYSSTRRPGAPGLVFRAISSNPGAGTFTPAEVVIGGTQTQALLTFTPVAAGQTTVTVTPPDGVTAQEQSKYTIAVEQPYLRVATTLIGKDLEARTSVSLPSNFGHKDQPVQATVTSTDPSRLLLSLCNGAVGTATVKVPVSPYGGGQGGFCVQALAGQGEVRITAVADGFIPASSAVQLLPTTLDSSMSSINMVAGTQTMQEWMRVRTMAPGYTGPFDEAVRPGGKISVGLSSSNPAVAQIGPATLEFNEKQNLAAYTITPRSAGSAALVYALPAGVVANPAELPITISLPALQLWPAAGIYGKDIASPVQLDTQVQSFPSSGILVSSSDPSIARVAVNCSNAGEASTRLYPTSYGAPSFCVQGMSDQGEAVITISADGFQTTEGKVRMAPITAAFASAGSALTLKPGASVPGGVGVELRVYDAANQNYYSLGGRATRPGSDLSVQLSSSNPDVLRVETPLVRFTDNTTQYVTVRAVAPGSAILTLGTLSGGVESPLSTRTIQFNVEP